ncbi:hypothetical protein DAPPUDRAFT_238585 [Daphnia pulex]|uniref:Uncharacterized protein n=1 Tax=Daphnia pulex TaxID=6669 RepID=E9G838_DAPPU|nr:hypothetical protein DAPPUDRAFT_238585 [Daphnia pulex]|eukprot:EFX84346.1 hypothetical protein DAPPUDRAFT_238585 [Daphnia pulex]
MAAGRVLSSISRFNPDLILRRKRGKAKTVILVRLYTAHSTNGRIYYEYTNRQLKEYAQTILYPSMDMFLMEASANRKSLQAGNDIQTPQRPIANPLSGGGRNEEQQQEQQRSLGGAI